MTLWSSTGEAHQLALSRALLTLQILRGAQRRLRGSVRALCRRRSLGLPASQHKQNVSQCATRQLILGR